MSAPLNELYRLSIAANGSTTITLPDSDPGDTGGFAAYVNADWTGPNVPRPSTWEFRRTINDTGDVVWSGTFIA